MTECRALPVCDIEGLDGGMFAGRPLNLKECNPDKMFIIVREFIESGIDNRN
jgi:hypothetical protein